MYLGRPLSLAAWRRASASQMGPQAPMGEQNRYSMPCTLSVSTKASAPLVTLVATSFIAAPVFATPLDNNRGPQANYLSGQIIMAFMHKPVLAPIAGT